MTGTARRLLALTVLGTIVIELATGPPGWPALVDGAVALSLFWRTFFLLAILLLGGVFAWVQTFRALEFEPRAVQQAPFRVLVGANMPAALVEIGYLSNPEQEQQLTSAAYQDKIAESLLDALIKFRTLLDRTAP